MKFASYLESFQSLNALVLGDLMLDEYVFGKVTRISQEAPVMVVQQTSTRSVPGGAANVASNMVALGAKTKIIGVLGTDESGEKLAGHLEAWGIDRANLVRDPSRPTTRKTRVVANHHHQVLRIDQEDEKLIEGEVEELVLQRALAEIDSVDIVLISDYQKGAVTPHIIREIVRVGREKGVPVVANPKPKSVPYYRGASLVSLNQFEAATALGFSGTFTRETAQEAAQKLKDQWEIDRILITLGGNGMAAAGETQCAVPAMKVDVYDEAGAGDTVIATVALGIGANLFGETLLELAAQTAGSVVQKVGVATPSQEDLARIASL